MTARYALVAVVVVVLLLGALPATSPKPATAGTGWGAAPLLSCPDVNADGAVTFGDFLALIQNFDTAYPEPDYLFLYDLDSNQAVSFPDFLVLLVRFGEACPLTDTQAALATLAAVKYKDPQQAFDDGYTWGSQYVPQMGVHLVNGDFQTQYLSFYDPVTGEDQLRHPVGLLYSERFPGSNQPDEFIGVWYNLPVQAVCDFYGIAGPCQSDSVQPAGFGETNTDEDNQDPPGPQQGWHVHLGLCVANWGTIDAFDWELGRGTETTCLSPPLNGDVWFSTYGWMLHLYNFVPNSSGRFMLWNSTSDFP
ncbi:MAG: EF-hand domain-containing protein [Chloroflexi bacterium]|nr:EF-hand domain-containing protein [Chloroflexota bacterium]